MRITLRTPRPLTALAAIGIITSAGLLPACSSSHTATPVAQPGSPAQQSPHPSQSPVPQQTTASPAAPAQPQPERLDPAQFSMVTVTAILPEDTRFNQHYSSAAVIARLARVVNGLPVAKPSAGSCPAGDISYQLLFTAAGSAPDIRVTTSSCPADQFSAGGKVGRPLWDRSGAVAATAHRMLKLKIQTSFG
jgi:hypothetical protein